MLNKNIKKNIQILVGCIVYVIGINFFLVPSNIFTTGLMGLAQEIAETLNLIFGFGFERSDSTFLMIQTVAYWSMNVPILIFGYNRVGHKFTIKTFIISSVVVQIFVNILVINQPLIVDYGTKTLASDIMNCIAGASLMGAGMGLIIKNGASAGGTDILAVYFSLYKGRSFGTFNLAINMIVVVWSILLTQDLTSGFLILICLYVQSYVVDLIYNYNSKSTIFVFTAKPKEVGQYIISHERTFTQFAGETGYSHNDITLLILVVNQEERKLFMRDIFNIDQNVFIDVVRSENVFGNFKNKYLTNL